MECSVSEKTICEPPSALHESLTAVAVTLILAGQAFRRAGGVQEGWLQPLSYTGEPAASRQEARCCLQVGFVIHVAKVKCQPALTFSHLQECVAAG